VVNLCGQKEVLFFHALHFSSEVIHEGAQFSTHHSRSSLGSMRCQSDQWLYFCAVCTLEKHFVSNEN